MAQNYDPALAELVRNCLNESGWKYDFDPEKGHITFGMNLKGKLKSIRFVITINEKDCNVYAVSPLSADQNDPEQLRQMAEFVCRANYGLKDGNFELDFRDGELRYKTYVNCDGMLPTAAIVKRSYLVPLAMFERYGQGILGILFTGMSAEDAVRLCEGK